jgi:hypothetical protein
MAIENVKVAVFIAVMLLAILLLALGYRKMIREKHGRVADRSSMSLDEFYTTYYEDSGLPKEAVARVLLEVASEVDMPAGKLRPSDRFSVELRPISGWEFDDGTGLLSSKLERLLRRAGAAVNTGSMRTLDDYIRGYLSVDPQPPQPEPGRGGS